MRAIKEIDQDRVERYGRRFLRVIATAHRTYQAILEAQGISEKNAIPISSSSNSEPVNSDFGDSDALDDEADTLEASRSQYFEADTDMSNFNERSK